LPQKTLGKKNSGGRITGKKLREEDQAREGKKQRGHLLPVASTNSLAEGAKKECGEELSSGKDRKHENKKREVKGEIRELPENILPQRRGSPEIEKKCKRNRGGKKAESRSRRDHFNPFRSGKKKEELIKGTLT